MLVALTTYTLFPAVYANNLSTINLIAKKFMITGSDVVLNLSPGLPVGPVIPVGPVVPVRPVGPATPSKFMLYFTDAVKTPCLYKT